MEGCEGRAKPERWTRCVQPAEQKDERVCWPKATITSVFGQACLVLMLRVADICVRTSPARSGVCGKEPEGGDQQMHMNSMHFFEIK